MGWSDYDTETLQWTRGRLLIGLARIRDHAAAGTLDNISEKGGGSARAAGYLTLILLDGVEAELKHRGELPDDDHDKADVRTVHSLPRDTVGDSGRH